MPKEPQRPVKFLVAVRIVSAFFLIGLGIIGTLWAVAWTIWALFQGGLWLLGCAEILVAAVLLISFTWWRSDQDLYKHHR